MIYLIRWEKYGFEAINTQLQICLVSIHLLANHIYQKYINDNWFNKKNDPKSYFPWFNNLSQRHGQDISICGFSNTLARSVSDTTE